MATHVQGRAGQTINFKGTLLYNGVEVGSKTISDNFKIGDPDAPENGSTAYTLPDEFEGQAIEIFSSDLGRFLIAGQDYTRNGMASQGLELTLLNGNKFLTGGYWNISGGKAIDGAQEVLDEAKAYTNIKTPWVTPEMFGAVGDGITDDTTAFQSCINSIDEDGGEIQLDTSKSYFIATPNIRILNKRNFKFNGNGATIIIDKATTNALPAGMGRCFIYLEACENSKVSGIRTDLGNFSGAVSMLNCINSEVNSNIFTNSGGSFGTIVCIGGVGNIIKNNVLEGSSTATRGIVTGGNNTAHSEKNCRVLFNKVSNLDASGIVTSCVDGVVQGNSCNNNNGSGIIWSGSDVGLTSNVGLSIIGNTSSFNSFHGIQQDGLESNAIIISDNICHNNDSAGIYQVIGRGCTINSNQCYDNGINGIYLDSSENTIISNNRCYDSRTGSNRTQQIGINITSQRTVEPAFTISNTIVSGNLCDNNTGDGIRILTLSGKFIDNINVNGNVCKGNGTNGFFVLENSPSGITNLSFLGNNAIGNGTYDMRVQVLSYKEANNVYVTKTGNIGGGGEFIMNTNQNTINLTGVNFVRLANTVATTINSITGGEVGQEVQFYGDNGNTSLQHNGTTILIPGGGNVNIPSDNLFTLRKFTSTLWRLIYRGDDKIEDIVSLSTDGGINSTNCRKTGICTVYVNCQSGNRVVTLASASSMRGLTVIFKKTDATANTLTVSASENINTATTLLVGNSATVKSNGTQFYTV